MIDVETMLKQRDAAISLAHRVTQDAINRMHEEFGSAEPVVQNAALLTLAGYMAGFGERVVGFEPNGQALFDSAKALGKSVGGTDTDIVQFMKDNRNG